MANEIGAALEIPQSVFNQIDKAEAAIKQLEQTARSSSDKINKSFMSLGEVGLASFLKRLKEVQGEMSRFDVSKLLSGAQGMSNVSQQAGAAATSITTAAAAMNQMGERTYSTTKNLAQLTEERKKLTKELTKGEGLSLTGGQQQDAVNKLEAVNRAIKEQSKGQIQLAEESEKAIKEEQRQDNVRYQAWLKQKDSELREEQRVEKEKQRAREASIKAYLASLEELKKRQAKWAEESTAAKNSGDVINKARREQEKMYEQMFATIEKKRKADEAAAEKAAAAEAAANKKKAEQVISDYQRQTRAAQEYRKQQEAMYSKLFDQALSKPQNALSFAESATSITQRTQAIKYLTAARAQLSTTDANYEQKLKALNDAIKKMNAENNKAVEGARNLQKQHSNLMNTSEQLARKLALIFSVSQISGYVSRLVRVRGEFELQNTALASILQNKDKADKLFGQITELAVKSPFTLKELTTYTKSLSAYQVEYEKLYDTTKMLADVSSGLGVDMQRLILAFGQVKAANYLRGTETRQFSEAGLNILGELAKYYSEVENRAVSLGEVQERQFKRMIKFQDVEEVFKRLTSAGGMFYQMQEKQADTLAGQMSNLQDSLDIMFNDMGKANDGLLKNMISLLREIIDNWENISNVVTPLLPLILSLSVATKKWGGAMGSMSAWGQTISTNLKAAMISLKNFGVQLNLVKASQEEFNKAAALNGWLMIGAAVIAIIYEVKNAIDEANKVQNELNKLSSEGFYNSEESVRNYTRLADTVADSTKSYQEQEQALEELKRTYGEILPQHYLEAEAIREMKGNYDEATAAIKNYMLAKTQEKQLQFLSNEYSDDIDKAQQNLIKYTQRILSNYYNIKLSTQEATIVMTKFREELEKGLIKTPEEARTKLEELFSEFLNKDISFTSANGTYFNLISINDYFSKIVEYKEKVDDVLAQTNASWADRITLQLQDMRKKLQSQIDEVNTQLNVISKQGQIGKDGGLITEKQVQLAKDRIVQIASNWGVEASKIEKLTGGAFEIKQATLNLNIAALKAFYKQVENMPVEVGQEGSKLMFLQQLQAEIDKLDPTPFQRYVQQIIFESAKLNNISFDGFVDAITSENEGVEDYAKRILEKIKQLRENINAFEQSPYLVPEWNGDKKNYNNAKKQLAVLYAIYKKVHVETDKERRKREISELKAQKSELDKLKERIELIKKAGTEYEKLIEYYDKGTASLKVQNAFKDAFKEAKVPMGTNFDMKGIIEQIENLPNKVGEKGEKEIKKAIAPLKAEQEINFKEKGLEDIKEKMEDIFSSYDFSLKLQTSKVDTNMLRNFLKGMGVTDDTLTKVGLNIINLEGLQKKVRATIADLQKGGSEKEIEIAKELQKKLTTVELEAAQKKYDELMRLREKYQTNEDKIAKEKTRLQGLEAEKAAIEAGLKQVSDEQKELIDYQIKESNDKIRQLESEALQLTDFWKQLFGDLENLSVSSLRRLVRMSDEVLANAKKVIEDGELKGYQSSYIDKDGNKKDATLTIEQYQRLLKKSSEVSNQIADKNPFIALYDAAKDGKKENETTLDYIERLKNDMDKAVEVAGQLADNLATIFGADEEAKQTLNDIMSIVKGTEELGVGIAQIASGTPEGIISGIMNASSGMAKIVSSINSIFDRGKEKEIKRQLEIIEDLQRAYEKLEKAIEGAYSIDTYNASYKNSIENIKKQNEALQKAINAERDKKGTDNDKIKQWTQQYEDNLDKIQELQDEFINNLGGFGSDANVKSAAEEFASAWLDAYLETGDGLDALKDKWDEYIKNIVAKQLMLKGTEKYLSDIMNLVDKQLEDGQFTTQEASEIQDKIDEVMPLLNEYWKAIAGSLKLPTETETGQLSGLQKGIEGVTEETAQALESLLNSIRYFVSDTNMRVNDLYRFFTNTPVESPLMQELKIQSRYLGNINSLVASVIKTTTGKGKVLRVEIV